MKEVQSVTQSKAFFSAHVNTIDKQELEVMFDFFRETLPNTPFILQDYKLENLTQHYPIIIM